MNGELVKLLSPVELEADIEEIERVVRSESKIWLDQFHNSDWGEKKRLNEWIRSQEGRGVRQKMADELWELSRGMQKERLTAHDWRHMVLVVWGVEEIIIEDKIDDYRLGAILGALMHDWGRIIETKGRDAMRARGEEYIINDEFHSRFSWWLAKKFFNTYRGEMPEEWENLILQAVAEHSRGRDGYDADGEIAQLVQTGDRIQLINAENYYRPQQEEVNERGAPLVGEGGKEDYFDYVEFFLREISLIAGEKRQEKEVRLKKMLRECLEVGRGQRQGRGVGGGLEIVRELWSNKLAANSEEEIGRFLGLVERMSEERREAFLRGCALCQAYRDRDAEEMEEKMEKNREIIEAEPLLGLGVKLWQD